MYHTNVSHYNPIVISSGSRLLKLSVVAFVEVIIIAELEIQSNEKRSSRL